GDKMSKVIKIYGQPKVGDSVQEMINAYGNTDSKHSDNGFEYYFYGVVTDDSLLQLIFKAKDNVIVEIHSTTN
ncbi:hypothetical protein IJJ97_04555, partial [bacterium]|nr:hypothetical protein [bacterium]